jgi:hypothetical protein
MNAAPSQVLVDWTPADWLAADALVVGYLRIQSDGIAFRPVVPNPQRSFFVPIIDLVRTSISSSGHRDPRMLEVQGMREPLRFLLADPRQSQLALDHALALFRHRGAYR